MKHSLNLTTSILLSTAFIVLLTPSAQAVSSPSQDLWPDADSEQERYGAYQGAYGKVLATGDFNGDSYMDQAISDPLADTHPGGHWGSYLNAETGAVNIKYGSPTGLMTAFEQKWTPASTGCPFPNQSFGRFGAAMATGDFNDDGYHDLAIGVPYEWWANHFAGSVVILYGSIYGLSTSCAQKINQDTPGINGVSELWDCFGASLAAGDFNGDGCDDLVVGVPGENIGSIIDAGMVHIIFGSKGGLSTVGDLCRHQDTTGVPGVCEEGDYFGSALATGDFDGDGYCDLAVGVPGEDLYLFNSSAGIVNLFRGGPSGISPAMTLSQVNWSIVGFSWEWLAEPFDTFGMSLASGDIDGDGTDDLVVGSPGEDFGDDFDRLSAGAVDYFLFKRGNGIQVLSHGQVHQNSPGIGGVSEHFDQLGSSLALGDLNGDGHADLVIGVEGEALGSLGGAGLIHVLLGSSAGLTATGSRVLSQNTWGVPCVSEAGDHFGGALSIGDFDADGYAELTVGVPDDDTEHGTGIIQVFPGSSSGPLTGAKTYHNSLDEDGPTRDYPDTPYS